jgi:predicted enzyme related to lactoylglutathione lyase
MGLCGGNEVVIELHDLAGPWTEAQIQPVPSPMVAHTDICHGRFVKLAPCSPSPSHPPGGTVKRVTGIGGIFFKAKDAQALQAWYKRHLGIDVQEWGGAAFTWTDGEGKPFAGTTAWSIGSEHGDQFAPSTATFMVNYRVEDLHALVKALREEGCNVLEKVDDSEYGKFAWVIDPEGNKVELWQPLPGE